MKLTASARVEPTTTIKTYDFQPPDRDYRCIGVDFDGLTIAFGLSGDDEERLDSLDNLIEKLVELRAAAMNRQYAAGKYSVTVRGPAPVPA